MALAADPCLEVAHEDGRWLLLGAGRFCWWPESRTMGHLWKESGLHCNFCSFERERSLTATYKIVSYNTNNNDYNDIAYICVECKKALDDNTLLHCNDCGRIMRSRIDCFCDLRKDEPVKTPTITEIMAQSYVGRLEQQNKDLKQQLSSAKEEISSHLEALEVSKDWHSKQRQELLDKVQRLETEVE